MHVRPTQLFHGKIMVLFLENKKINVKFVCQCAQPRKSVIRRPLEVLVDFLKAQRVVHHGKCTKEKSGQSVQCLVFCGFTGNFFSKSGLQNQVKIQSI